MNAEVQVGSARIGGGKPVIVKKGQLSALGEMANLLEKIRSTRNKNILLKERGSSFAYHNLAVDMRGLPIMRELGVPVVFDGTHSVQWPGGSGIASSDQREFVTPLIGAAVAAGCDGLFLEVHPGPDQAPSDGSAMLPLRAPTSLLAGVTASTRTPARPG